MGEQSRLEEVQVSKLPRFDLATPMSALSWHNMGLVYASSAQQYIDTQLAYNIQHFNQALIFFRTLMLQMEEPLLYLRVYACWFDVFTTMLQAQQAETEQHVDNAYKSAIQYFYQANNACVNDASLKQIIKLNLTEYPAQYGHYLYKNGAYSSAEKYYSQTIKFDPFHLIALNQLGMCALKKELFPEARHYFADIIGRTQDKKEQADAWFNIAYTYRLQNNWRKAANALREAKKLTPYDRCILEEEEAIKELIATTFFSSLKIKTMFHQHDNASESLSNLEKDHSTNSTKPY